MLKRLGPENSAQTILSNFFLVPHRREIEGKLFQLRWAKNRIGISIGEETSKIYHIQVLYKQSDFPHKR